jgi:TolB protein
LSNAARPIRRHAVIAVVSLLLLAATSSAQDWIRTGTGLGVERVRLAASDFKPSTSDANNANLLKTFNDTLWNDLDNAGIFDLVSKSFYPLQEPGQPSDVNFTAWNSPPPNTSMLAFGNLGAAAGKVTVQGWLYDR